MIGLCTEILQTGAVNLISYSAEPVTVANVLGVHPFMIFIFDFSMCLSLKLDLKKQKGREREVFVLGLWRVLLSFHRAVT